MIDLMTAFKIALLVTVVGFVSFGLGMFSMMHREPKVDYDNLIDDACIPKEER